MSAQSRTVLKSYFQRGLRPTQAQYGDLIDSFELVSGAATSFLPLAGGIMTGAIQLPGVPTSALAAATKGYVDAIVSAGGVVIGGSNGQIQYNNSGVLGGLTVSGDASLASTGVFTLNNTAVSAGTYELATVTFNTKGLAISASSGSSSTAVKSVKKQIFTNSGTYTPSAGMVYCIAEVLGAGGGGGSGGSTGQTSGAGGGAGAYGKSWLSAASIGASQVVTIGAAGAASSAGGTSSLGSLISCTGGAAGTNGGAGSFVNGGVGGASSSADLNIPGNTGLWGASSAGTTAMGGYGANSPYGNGGSTSYSSGGANGSNAQGYGAGGQGGGNNANTGGTGTSGIIIITEFCST